jgi:hypothetical protein
MDRNTTAIGIDDPVFPHTTTVEQFSLDSLVATARDHDREEHPMPAL